MNTVNIIGRLTRDPVLRHTDDGKSVCDLTVAVEDTFSKDDRTDFLRVTAWGNQAENCAKYLQKGLMCGVNGRLRSDTYTDQDGVKRYPVSITADRVQFLQLKPREQAMAAPEAEAERDER